MFSNQVEERRNISDVETNTSPSSQLARVRLFVFQIWKESLSVRYDGWLWLFCYLKEVLCFFFDARRQMSWMSLWRGWLDCVCVCVCVYQVQQEPVLFVITDEGRIIHVTVAASLLPKSETSSLGKIDFTESIGEAWLFGKFPTPVLAGVVWSIHFN